MSDALTYANAHERLAEAVPELRPRLERELDSREPQSTAPQHSLFASVLVPFLVERLGTDRVDDDVHRAFAFVERMATSEDDEVANVAQISVVAHLGDDAVLLERARRLMGPATAELSRQIELAYGRE